MSVTAPVVLLGAPAQAAPGLTASKTTGIAVAGETVTVRGSGFDPGSGIYVTVCVDNGAGAQPTPCLGGIPEDGEATAYSAWFSNDPQWEGVATTWDGSFSVQLRVQAVSGRTDCRTAPRGCVLVTRGDHTQGWSRQITRIPLTFAGGAGVPATSAPVTRAPAAATPTRTPVTAPGAGASAGTGASAGPGGTDSTGSAGAGSGGAGAGAGAGTGPAGAGGATTDAGTTSGATAGGGTVPGAASASASATASTTATASPASPSAGVPDSAGAGGGLPQDEPRLDAVANEDDGGGGSGPLLVGVVAAVAVAAGGGGWFLRRRGRA